MIIEKGQARGAGGQFISGKATELPSSFGAMDSGYIGGRQPSKRRGEAMATNINL